MFYSIASYVHFFKGLNQTFSFKQTLAPARKWTQRLVQLPVRSVRMVCFKQVTILTQNVYRWRCNSAYVLICWMSGGCSNVLLFICYFQNKNSCYKVYGDACSCSVTQNSGRHSFSVTSPFFTIWVETTARTCWKLGTENVLLNV